MTLGLSGSSSTLACSSSPQSITDALHFSLKVGDFPPDLLSVNTFVAAIVGRPSSASSAASSGTSSRRLTGVSTPPEAGQVSAISITAAQADAFRRAARRFGTPAYVTDLEAGDRRPRGDRRPSGPVAARLFRQSQRVPRSLSRPSRRTASRRTSSRAANGRPQREPVSRTTDHARGGRQDAGRPPCRRPCRALRTSAPLGGHRITRGGGRPRRRWSARRPATRPLDVLSG